MQVLKCADFNPAAFFKDAPKVKNRRGNPGKKIRHYIGITTAFDIETSILPGTEQAFMYIWQWAFGEGTVVIGRTWEEFTDLQNRIRQALPEGYRLVVYVHNLSYEFQYLKGIYSFNEDEVFAVGSRKVVKADMYGAFEFRCSYKLTNMSLGEFTKKMNVEHKKLSGDEYDYSQIRYPWTELSEQELAYCYHDVIGLVEALNALLARDGDTLSTVPMTSTGYVRREAKAAMRQGASHHAIRDTMPDYDVYLALREAFRGGNTHANRYYTGDVVHQVHSADRSSSYPYCLCNKEYPAQFIPIMPSDLNMGYIMRCIRIRHKALLLRIGIKDLKLRDPYWGCPYLSKDKCRNIHQPKLVINDINTDPADNGRILEAEYLETTITDVDLEIIAQEYTGTIIILQGWYASYKPLPRVFVEEVIKYYRNKTELKGVPGQEIYYDKAKALLNSLYGMCAMDPVKHRQLFRQVGDFEEDRSESDEALLEKANKRSMLSYSVGCWCTAWARKELEEGIRLVHETPGADFIYADTDSVKYIGSVDWSSYNDRCISECKISGAMAVDPAGITHYMGVFESEDDPDTGYCYYEFKTLGAKKYAFTKKPGSGTSVTIAGVNKKKGGAELDKHGGLSAFHEGFLFVEAGGTQAVYNDAPDLDPVEIDGHVLRITANVAILPSTYRLGITGEYERIITYFKSYLDNPYVL